MTSDEELMIAVNELRDELKQIKEIVNILFTMVMENEMDDDDLPPEIPLKNLDSDFSVCN